MQKQQADDVRQSTSLLLVLMGLVLVAVIVGIAARFALPRRQFVAIGLLSDYPPASEPYTFIREIRVFVINNGGEIIVLDHITLNSAGFAVIVNWIEQETVFINPVGGAHYDLTGCPFRWAPQIETTPAMLRYPVEIRDEQIRVDISRPSPACENPVNYYPLEHPPQD